MTDIARSVPVTAALDRQKRLTRRSLQLREFISRLARSEASFDIKLFQVFAAYRREINRKLNRQVGTARDFEDVILYWAVGVTLLSDHTKYLAQKQDRNEAFNGKDKATTRFLGKALHAFERAAIEFRVANQPVPDLVPSLPEQIFFHLHSVTRDEAEQIAVRSAPSVQEMYEILTERSREKQ